MRVPGGWPDRAAAEAAWAFPVVGAGLGLLAGLAHAGASAVGASPTLAAIVATALLVIATGALHEDGLADTADALGSPRPREAALAVMRDSRIGTYGAVALALVLAGRVAALVAVTSPAAAILVAAVLSRAAIVAVMAALPPARPDGQSAAAGRPHAVLCGVAWVIAALTAASAAPPFAAASAILTAGVVTLLAIGWLRQRLGGQTGDTLGAVQQASEVAVLCVLSLHAV